MATRERIQRCGRICARCCIAPWWDPLLRDGLASVTQIDTLRRCFEEHRGPFDAPRSCLVYADGGLRDFLVDRGRVVGLVDTENVVAAEAVNDFDALARDTEEEFNAVCEGYDRPGLFAEVFFRRLALYRVLFAYPRLACYHRRGDRMAVAETQRRIRELVGQFVRF